jgi:EAL domain-containing protein (putative c-di-GMP-specific phosphodiesterase class I)/CheY-like chemotaxis protein
MTASQPQGTPRVLVVDDKAFVRAMMGRVLEAAGIANTDFAANGREALTLIQRSDPPIDIVICDLLMPDMDGVEVVRYVAELNVKPVFVFVSGQSASLLTTAVDMARARGLTVLGAIEKPVSLEAIRGMLQQYSGDAGPRPARGSVALYPADLQQGLAMDQIVLHYQPKVDLRTHGVVGYESLARWQHPLHGLIPPGQFISLAEESQLIGPLTDRVMQLALQQCSAWNSLGFETKISINISAHMLVDLNLPDRISREAEQFRVAPSQIVLEITETGLFQDTGDTLDILARLHMKGFPLSIDDFGTGYSSMDQLRRVPFSELKIDRAFVHGAATNHKARAILESSAALAKKLGLSLVAEGAEDRSDWDVLLQAEVDLVQGYYVAKPMPAADVPRWAAKWDGSTRPRAGSGT